MVYYALSPRHPLYERQWIQSVRSIRQHNQTIPIFLYLFGTETPAIIQESARHDVTIIAATMPHFNLPDYVLNVLTQYPVMHKFVPLTLIPTGMQHVLYLDCDTFLHSNVETLFTRYANHHFYAREEPNTRRSNGNGAVDDHMIRLTTQDGLHSVPPYNMGTCLFNHGLWKPLGDLTESLFINTYRFMMDLYTRGYRGFDARLPYGTALAYPTAGINAYIVEQVALWYTWGNEKFDHGVFARQDVSQSAEEYIAMKGDPILTHYYHLSEELFFQQVKRLT